MTNATAVIIAAAIIGLSILGARFLDRYRISALKGADENPAVFRVDTITGAVVLCRFTQLGFHPVLFNCEP
jgi:hypothetical protein